MGDRMRNHSPYFHSTTKDLNTEVAIQSNIG
jgi:hypothetical protein